MIVVGELINSTRKKVKEAMEKKDSEYIRNLAIKQDEAGADFIDVNASPYSEKIYGKLGFVKTKEIKKVNGMTFVPMKMVL